MDGDGVRTGERDISDSFEAETDLVVVLRRRPSGDQPGENSSREERRALGRRLVAAACSRLLDVDRAQITVTARCARCGGDHGRPLVSIADRSDRAFASVSHGGGSTAVAVSQRAVGVDIEPVEGSTERFAAIRAIAGPWARGLADGPDILRAWTIIEAVVKADGRGLEIDPGRVHLDSPTAVTGARATIDGSGPSYAVSSAVADGLVVSVAVSTGAVAPGGVAAG